MKQLEKEYLNHIGSNVTTWTVIIVIFVFVSSCESDRKADTNINSETGKASEGPLLITLKEFTSIFGILKPYSWSIYSGYEDEGSVYLEADSKVGDTLIFARLSKVKAVDLTKSIYQYTIMDFIKSYSIGEKKFDLSLLSNQDTLYLSYFIDSADFQRPNFVVGGYAFKYMNNRLKTGERRFYEQHSDSLRKVRGSDLPSLPIVEDSY